MNIWQTVWYHTDTNMSGNACLLLIKARQTDKQADGRVALQNQITSMRNVSLTLSLYTVYTHTRTVVQMIPLQKKQHNSETVLAENMCKPLRVEEDEE